MIQYLVSRTMFCIYLRTNAVEEGVIMQRFPLKNENNSFDAESSTDVLQKPNIHGQTGADAECDTRLPTFEEEVEATLAHLDSVSEMHDFGSAGDKYQDFPVYAVVNKRKLNGL